MLSSKQMNQREPNPRPPLCHRPQKNSRKHVHSLLEAELRDIRRSLSRLEHELEGNVVEIRGTRNRRSEKNEDKAA